LRLQSQRILCGDDSLVMRFRVKSLHRNVGGGILITWTSAGVADAHKAAARSIGPIEPAASCACGHGHTCAFGS
jgi:hypothetical protein